ncbi:hypothetical protein D3C83_197680 [compost metagenome]
MNGGEFPEERSRDEGGQARRQALLSKVGMSPRAPNGGVAPGDSGSFDHRRDPSLNFEHGN